MARVRGAWIIVITGYRRLCATNAVGTGFIRGAGIAVVTWRHIRGKDTIAIRASLVGARVAVVATDRGAAGALSIHAGIVCRTRVGVIARSIDLDVFTARRNRAAILGACVTIVAGKRPEPDTVSIRAWIIGRTAILVVAIVWMSLVDATQGRIAGIVGTRIAVVTRESIPTRYAASVLAGVIERADVTITARGGVIHKDTSGGKVTGVGGAIVFVITRNLPTHTCPLVACVSLGACIAIVTLKIVRSEGAACLWTCIVRAGIAVIADKRSGTRTRAFTANIAQRAGVIVIAQSDHIYVATATEAVACIGGAWIVIAAIDRLAYAHACVAVVTHCTSIAIEAFALGEKLMLTPVRARTGIDRAAVTVVARVLVDHAVAIVIHAVAGFVLSEGCGTRSQAFGLTNAHPLANADIAFAFAGGHECRGDG
jgi:hypothetical protein